MSYLPDGAGTLTVEDSTGAKHIVRIITRVAYAPAEAPVDTRRSLDQGERTSVGDPGDGSITFDYEPHPGLRSNRIMQANYIAKTTTSFEHLRGTAAVLRDNSTTADTIAIATSGVATGAGGINFGTDAAPRAPWNQGLGLVISNVLYTIEEILSSTTIRVSRYGSISSNRAIPDDTALAAVSATHSWDLVQTGVSNTYSGRISLAGGEESSGAGEVSSTATVQLSSAVNTELVTP